MTALYSEFWSAAVMFAAEHGLEAEAIAAEKLYDAMENAYLGDILIWREIAKRLPTILALQHSSLA